MSNSLQDELSFQAANIAAKVRGNELLVEAEKISDQYYNAVHDATNADRSNFFEDNAEVVGTMRVSIVGIRYYRGYVHAGEHVKLVREPRNPYDVNAIRVDNVNNVQVGHIKRQTAAYLAKALDTRGPWRLRFEALVPNRTGDRFSIDCELSVLCFPIVFPLVSKWILEGQYNGGQYRAQLSDNAQAVKDVEVTTKVMMKSQEELEALIDANEKLQEEITEKVPAKHPLMNSILYPFQVLGVSWMLRRERSGTPKGEALPALWKKMNSANDSGYFSEITNNTRKDPPPPVRGGILADDMGLGKTVQVIALVTNNPPPGVVYKEAVEDTIVEPDSKKAKTEEELSPVESRRAELLKKKASELKDQLAGYALKKSGSKSVLVERLLEREGLVSKPVVCSSVGNNGRGTLLVVPKGLLHNWHHEINKHMKNGVYKVVIYHGAQRTSLNSELPSCDIVITTLGTLAQESKVSATSALMTQAWWRVVIDEAHEIRNRTTAAFKAVNKLNAVNRWCLTGTPFYNSIEDLQSLLAWIKYQPIDDYAVFRRVFGRPVRDGNPFAIQKFRVLMSSLMLRRKKSQVLQLPPITVDLHTVQLEGEQKRVYDTLQRATTWLFRTAAQAGDNQVMKDYMLILEAINRMRQACLDPSLVPLERIQLSEKVLREAMSDKKMDSGQLAEVSSLSAEEAAKLFTKLKDVFTGKLGDESGGQSNQIDEEQVNECVICLDDLEEESAQVLRTCMHTFCKKCLLQWKAANPKCPLCRAPFVSQDILSVSDLVKQHKAKAQTANNQQDQVQEPKAPVDMPKVKQTPVKITALVRSLQSMMSSEPDGRALVFSTFTSFLDIIASHLDEAGITYGRVDGRVSAKNRQVAQDAFQQDNGGPLVMLISLKAGGQGLTLTRANYVYMVDPWWSLSSENQAYDRVHRIGQTKPVKVIRYVVKNSIEERVLRVQEQKSQLAKALLDKKKQKKLTPEELRAQRLSDLNELLSGASA